ncbi:hypothetical protein F5X99DRAFT_389558 [Biscogniauxia marginata]|nr:hypothetical protein F5X99DRAFT_389558 [Biscogniauxia marginata]
MDILMMSGNAYTHRAQELHRCLIGEYDNLYQHHPRPQGDILTPPQVYNRLRHCHKTTERLLQKLEPYNNLSTPLCELMIEAVGEEVHCINLVRRRQLTRKTTQRIRRLENLLKSYDDLLCRQPHHNDHESIVEDAKLISRKWHKIPTTQDGLSSPSPKKSIDSGYSEWQEYPAKIKDHMKDYLVDDLKELIWTEKDVWRSLKDHINAHKSSSTLSECCTSHPLQLYSNTLVKSHDVGSEPVPPQAERVADTTSEVEAPVLGERCADAKRTTRWAGNLPEPVDMSSRHAMLRRLETGKYEMNEKQPVGPETSSTQQEPQHGHESQQLTCKRKSPSGEESASRHKDGQRITSEQERLAKKQAIDQAVELVRKFGRGEIRIPSAASEKHVPRLGLAGKRDEDEDDNVVLRELKRARWERWGSGSDGGSSSSDSAY